MLSLMYKLKNLSDLTKLTSREIELLTSSQHDTMNRATGSKINILTKTSGNIRQCDIKNTEITSSKCDYYVIKKSGKKSSTEAFVCPNCYAMDRIIEDQFGGCIVCSSCGFTLETNMYDHTPEWRNYDDKTDNERCGVVTNSLLPQTSLGTSIGGANYRLKTLHNWGIVPPKERSLNIVLMSIKRACEKAHLMKCIEDDAKILYRNARDCKEIFNHTNKNRITVPNGIIIRGKNRTGLMAACVYYACKRYGHTKSLKEIAKLFSIKLSRANKGCRNFIKYTKYTGIDYKTNISRPSNYVQHYCEELRIDKKYIDEIIKLSEIVHKFSIATSHTPLSVAAACTAIFVSNTPLKDASDKYISKEYISSIFGISEVTITKAFNKIIIHKDKIFEALDGNNVTCDDFISPNKNATHHVTELSKRLKKIEQIDTSNYFSDINIQLHKYMSYDLQKHHKSLCTECPKYLEQLLLTK